MTGTPNTVAEDHKTYWRLFMDALQGKQVQKYTDGSINRAAFILAIPMMLEMFMESVFAIVDILFVSSLGAEAVAVVGLTEAVLILIYAVAIGLSMAATSIVARRVGEERLGDARRAGAQAMLIGLFFAIIITLFGAFYAEPILRFMGADEKIIEQGLTYATLMFGGSLSIVFMFLNNAIFRGAGDAITAMRALWIANGLNIILDPLLIFGIGPFPELGVTGAAVATNTGRSIGIVFQLYYLFYRQGTIQLKWKHFKPHFTVLRQLLKVAAGGIAQYLLTTASWMLLVKIIAHFGSNAIAGYTIAIRIILFTIMPAWGLSNAVATLVGQNLGAGKPIRAEQSVWTIAKYNTIFLVFVGLILIVFAETLLSPFTNDEAVIATGAASLRYISLGFGGYAIGMVLIQAFNGAGDTRTPTRINLFSYWLVQLPCAYLLAITLEVGLVGVFISIIVSDTILALYSYSLFRKGAWKHEKIE